MAKSNPDVPCAINECGKPSRNRGWCSMHYERWRSTGTTDSQRPTLEQRVLSSIDKTSSPEGCWLWTGTISNSTGYGQIAVDKQPKRAHRIVYEMFTGELLGDRHIDHKCFNRICVNPEHLRPVTQKQNNENRSGAQCNSLSGIRGVSRTKSGKWSAIVNQDGKNHYLGVFDTAVEADQAARLKRLELFTHSDGR